MYTQVSRGNVFTCTSVRAAILKNLKLYTCSQIVYKGRSIVSYFHGRVTFVCLGLGFTSQSTFFSVMSGRSHRFLGITSAFWEVNVSC